MQPDYAHKLFNDQRICYVLLVMSLAAAQPVTRLSSIVAVKDLLSGNNAVRIYAGDINISNYYIG